MCFSKWCWCIDYYRISMPSKSLLVLNRNVRMCSIYKMWPKMWTMKYRNVNKRIEIIFGRQKWCTMKKFKMINQVSWAKWLRAECWCEIALDVIQLRCLCLIIRKENQLHSWVSSHAQLFFNRFFLFSLYSLLFTATNKLYKPYQIHIFHSSHLIRFGSRSKSFVQSTR